MTMNEDTICNNCRLQELFPKIYWSKIKCSNYKDDTCPLKYLETEVNRFDEKKNTWIDYKPITEGEYILLRILLFKMHSRIKTQKDRMESWQELEERIKWMHANLMRNECRIQWRID